MTENGSSPDKVHSQSFLDALKAAGAALSSGLHTRLNLFLVELEEGRERFKQNSLLGLVAFFGLNFGFILFSIFIVALFLDKGWLVALGCLSVFYLALGGVAALMLRKRFLTSPGLFPATLAELDKDRDRLRSHE